MIRLAFSLLAVIGIQGLCRADVTKLPAPDQKALREVAGFHEIQGATNLPAAVFSLCADDNGRLADRGKRWQATDVIKDHALPRKRLIWAVTDGEYYVVHYERGGYAHSFHVIVAKLKARDSSPSLVWRCVGQQLKNFKAFLDALATNKLDDAAD